MIIPSFILLLFLSDIVSFLRLTLDHALHFKNNHLLMKNIQKYYCNNNIKSSASNKYNSQPYHSLNWLVTVSSMNKVKINSWFTNDGFVSFCVINEFYTLNGIFMFISHFFYMGSNDSTRFLQFLCWCCGILAPKRKKKELKIPK